jgi:hypothetical protein
VGYARDADAGNSWDEIWMCPAYAGLHTSARGYFGMAHLPHCAPAVYAAGFFCRREVFEGAGGFDENAGALADADFCLRAWTEKRLRSLVLPGADLISPCAVPPLAAKGAFGEKWEPALREKVPFQSPYLAWTPGGWRLRP